jgi:branched-chain amino acid transport system ATP-binding protein
MIEVRQLSKHFGGVVAVNNVSLQIASGSITGLIGPNGAGKTTLFNVVAGNLAPSSGHILFDGKDVTGLESHQLFHKGLLRTFQIAHEFSKLTVLENLMVVPAAQAGENLLSTWIRPGLVRRQEAIVLEKAREVLEFLNLSHLSNTIAGNLSGGQKKLLELGRTMMVLNGKAVLLDEIGAGVNRALLAEIGTAIQRLNQELGYTFCMIEHDLDFISRMCDRVIVMAEGEVLTEGTVEDIKANEEVIEAYLGTGMKHRRTAIAVEVANDAA